MTMPDHNERCRQLAELIEEVHDTWETIWETIDRTDFGQPQPYHNLRLAPRKRLDPRFAALRGEHIEVSGPTDYYCLRCDVLVPFKVPYCLRKDADAWLECAAACGYRFVVFEYEPRLGVRVRLLKNVSAGSDITARYPGKEVVGSYEKTNAEAISAALWQAVVGTKGSE